MDAGLPFWDYWCFPILLLHPICLDADPTVCMPHALSLCSHFSGKNCKDEYLPEAPGYNEKEFEPQIFLTSYASKARYSANAGAIHQKDMEKKAAFCQEREGDKGAAERIAFKT